MTGEVRENLGRGGFEACLEAALLSALLAGVRRWRTWR